MSVCELRRATLYDTDAVYALICELKQGQFDLQAFSAGYAANLQDPNMRYQLALLDGQSACSVCTCSFICTTPTGLARSRNWW